MTRDNSGPRGFSPRVVDQEDLFLQMDRRYDPTNYELPIEEEWRTIFEFPNYLVSSEGRIMRTHPLERIVTQQRLPDGSLGVKLSNKEGQMQFLVRRLVAEAWVPVIFDNCDTVIQKDYVKANCHCQNLAWRPRWFAWKYAHQIKEPTLEEWHQIPIRNAMTGMEFRNLIEACTHDGVLWQDAWNNINTGHGFYPGVQYNLI